MGLFTKPIVILNTNGFYNPLKEMLERCISQNFMDEKHMEMWAFVSESEQVISAIKDSKKWSADAINFATNK